MKDSQASDQLSGSEIAIVGMACRFPGAKTIDAFWKNLRDGVESISFFSDEQLLASGVDPEALHASNYVKARPVLEDIELFDPAFFGFSPREAAAIDPQHRLFMECVWEAIESAGFDAESYKGLISLYAGASMSSYLVNNLYANPQALALAGEYESYLSNVQDSLSTRIAYKLNLKGACYNVQTFCSTSLVAVHLACQGLLNYECDMAVAGGVTVFVPQNSGYWYREGMIVSPDGHCRSFDAQAQGTIFGNGLGAVVLKRLEDALADNDHIEAVIIGSATNNDGSLKVSYTAPSVSGQAEVIVESLAAAGVNPETIDYIEAHGTGTALGDPTEVRALSKAFRTGTDKSNFCAIGSVKSNIGHLDAAGGVAGLIKTVLAIKHKAIPASLHFKKPNPEIDFANSPFYVNSELSEWQSNGSPRRAGVSAFGVGGTNSHVILQEAPEREPFSHSRSHQLLLLSARTTSALDTMTSNLAKHLQEHGDINIPDAAYTLQVGRKAFSHRRMIVCQNDLDSAKAVLGAADPKRMVTVYQERRNPPVVFMFSGQGSQYVNMGLELYRNEAFFRNLVDQCCEILQSYLGFDLRDIIYPADGGDGDSAQKLMQTSIAQPALFTIEYALAKLWMSWGVKPEAMVGHSIGEYVAGCLAQVFSLEDALSLVSARGRLMQTLPHGAMLAVSLSEAKLHHMIGEDLSLAAINAPTLCVVSGRNADIEKLEHKLTKQDVHFTRLHTSHAFHSKMMDPILEEFGQTVEKVELNPPQIPLLSNTTGAWMQTDEAIQPEYWVKHLRQSVRFSDCMRELIEDPKRILLEVGPGQTLCTLARQHINNPKDHVILASLRHPKEDRSDVEFVLTTLGRLWMAGIELDWSRFYRDENRYRIALPTYPFERQRYWIDPQNPPLGYPAYQAGLIKGTQPKELPENEEIQIDNAVPRDSGLASDYAAPRNEVEQKIAEIWQRLLGVNPVGIQDDFFELGGNSLVATRIIAEIENVFSKKLPLSILLNSPTIEQLANVITDEDWSWSPLVPLQSEGVNPPFFCIHGADGQVYVYRDLSRHLGSDQPFYGLQSQGLDDENTFHNRIEDMASLYVKEIQTVQPEGPYFLGGYCMGGTIAFEMAQQLQSQGQQVDLLVLLETYNWANFVTPSFFGKANYYKQKIEFHWRNLFLAESKWTFLREKVKVAKNRSKMWTGSLQAKLSGNINQGNGFNESLARLWDTNELAAADYRPKIYSGQITQFRPMKEYSWYQNSDMGWENLTTERVEDHILTVYPAGMLVEPFVEKLATELKACIRKAIEKDRPN